MPLAYGAVEALPPGEEAAVLRIEKPPGTHGCVRGLYVKWTNGLVNTLVADDQIQDRDIYYDIGQPRTLEPLDPPIYFERYFEVRSRNQNPGLISLGQFDAPQILPFTTPEFRLKSQATVTVDPAVDTIAFSVGADADNGTVIVLTSPSGKQMTFTRNGARTSTAGVIFLLSGAGVQNPGNWAVTGNMVGEPVDGTWTVAIITRTYISDRHQAAAGINNAIQLAIGGKTIRFDFVGPAAGGSTGAPGNNPQFWNWHASPALYDETEYPDPDVDPAEDPAIARFFQADPTGSPLNIGPVTVPALLPAQVGALSCEARASYSLIRSPYTVPPHGLQTRPIPGLRRRFMRAPEPLPRR